MAAEISKNSVQKESHERKLTTSFMGFLSPLAGLVLAFAGFSFDEQFHDSSTISVIHAISAFVALPLGFLVGACSGVFAWRTKATGNLIFALVLLINVVPLLILLLALAWPIGE
ncbi:MAG: hypothetical protein ACKVY0_19355 [Prosthecobacter sp.]|uniref:hypothetical protein n=1 Tax=Prosthecobacter sp. TaxID=1965333 RepID=UPI003900EAB8